MILSKSDIINLLFSGDRISANKLKSLTESEKETIKGSFPLFKDIKNAARAIKQGVTGICTTCGKSPIVEKYFSRYKDEICQECFSERRASRLKETCIRKYGTPNVSSSSEIKEKKIKTFMEKYGTMNALSSNEVRKKIAETNKEKYGHENPFASDLVRKKIAETNKEKYGHENFNSSEEGLRRRSDMMKGFFADTLSEESRLYYMNSDKLYDLFLESESSYRTVSEKTGLNEQLIYLILKRDGYSLPSKMSVGEKELLDHVRKMIYPLEVISGDRTVISPKEIDILVADKKIGIEYHGLYWHSTATDTPKNYHVDKWTSARNSKYSLLQFFEDEWVFKKDVVLGIISSKFGLNTKVHARKCVLRSVSSSESKKFCDDYHLQGGVQSKYAYGLFMNDDLLSVMTFGKSRFNESVTELLRFCSKPGITVTGGASKLFRAFVREHNPTRVMSYSNNRISNGEVYISLGFVKVGDTEPGYSYTRDFIVRESRQKFQKHKLEGVIDNFDPSLTEEQNMSNAGYHRVYDAGNQKYSWDQNAQNKN